MLVLSRKVNEAIMIGKEIKITVVAVSNNRVQLSIEAPRSVSIRRGELQPCTEETKK